MKVDDRALPAGVIYKNQLFVILELLSRFRWFHFKVDAIEYRSNGLFMQNGNIVTIGSLTLVSWINFTRTMATNSTR